MAENITKKLFGSDIKLIELITRSTIYECEVRLSAALNLITTHSLHVFTAENFILNFLFSFNLISQLKEFVEFIGT
jgi:hypothetical protein